MNIGLGIGLQFSRVTEIVPTFLNTFGIPKAAFDLSDLGGNPNVLKVRRSSDDAEADFKPSDILSGALINWVNGLNNEVMVNPDITSATGWTIGSGTTYNAATEAFDLSAASGLTVRQDVSEEGVTYEVTFTISSYTSGSVRVYAGGTQSITYSAAGTYTVSIVGGSSNAIFGLNPTDPTTLSISEFSAIQKTADGAVRIYYNQGSGADANQTSASLQPLIVDKGTLYTENGLPALKFNATTQKLDLASTITLTDEFYFLSIFNRGSTNSYSLICGSTANDDSILIFNGQNRFKINSNNNATFGTNPPNNQYLLDWQRDGSNNLNVTQNNTAYGSTVAGASGVFSIDTIGTNIGINSIDGALQSIIAFDSDKSAEAADIRANRNDYYSIY